MGLIGASTLAATRYLVLPARIAAYLKPPLIARNTGAVLCSAIVIAIFTLAIPNRLDEQYYYIIDDTDFITFVWIEENLGADHHKAILDPHQAVPFTAITGIKAHSYMGSRYDPRSEKTQQFLNSGCTDNSFIEKNGITIVYTPKACDNPRFTEVKRNVYVLEKQPKDQPR